ncbi:MAG: PQQ-binding-like beta-propeller repeat protein, partial [Candidatus Bathyarchaeia archaeon]
FYPSMMVEVASWQVRSSPIVVSNKLYVGGLDGKVYCLDTSNGNILWSYTTGMPIVGSPAYYNGKIYITSLDKNVYCLDANTGTKIWNWTTPKVVYGWTYLFMVNTPTVINGVVCVGAGGHSLSPTIGPVYMAALNATTGAEIWVVQTYPIVMWSGDNSNQPFAPTVVGDTIYHPCYMGVAARNAKNGSLIWHQWLGFQVFSSVLYVEDPFGPKLYVGSDSYSITCLDAQTGETLSVYTTSAQVVSSPAVYDGMIYVGSCDGCIYCLGDKPTYCPTIVAWCDWKEAYAGENIIVHSRLLPGLPSEKVILTLTKPDGSQVHINKTTDQLGWVRFNFTVDTAGDWSWAVWYEGNDKGYIVYTYAFTDTHPLTVKTTIEQQPTVGPVIPTEYILAIIIIVAIIIIAAAAYLIKRKK